MNTSPDPDVANFPPPPPPPRPPSRKNEARVRTPQSVRPALLTPTWAEAPVRAVLRAFAGLVFLYLGALKISVKTFEYPILGTRGLDLASGPGGFAQYLAAAGVPLPEASAYLVVLVEVLCGLGLILGVFMPLAQLLTRLFAVALAVDMLVAIGSTGVRNLIGHPVLLQGVPAMSQAWRFPLEVGLLGVMSYFLIRPVFRQLPLVSEKLRILTEPPRLRWSRDFTRM